MCKPAHPGIGLLAIGCLLLASLAGCDGNDDDHGPPIQQPPPQTELTWDQGNWNELDWQ